MNNEKTVKKMSEILRTDLDNLIPSIDKIKKEIEYQESEIRKMEERV